MKANKLLCKLFSILLITTITASLFAGCSSKNSKSDKIDESTDETIVTDSSSNQTTNKDDNAESGNTSSLPSVDLSFSEESYGTSTLNTGNLTQTGNGYEGIKGTGNYNYGEALQKSLLFYELQRSGDLPELVRCNWRGDSCLSDGSDNGLDLTGGLYDAGDNVKFNLPMAYTGSILGWSIYEDFDSYEQSNQLEYALSNVKWISDYLIKCHPEDEVFYYQVGDGNKDHSWWGPVEVINMERPSFKVTKDNPGSTVVAEAAACLAITSILYKDIDSTYSATCLSHAESLFKFADETKSDSGYTAANGFYNSWSGFYDELSWSSVWLYLATNNNSYLESAKEYYTKADQNSQWALCWDDVHIGAALLLARITNDQTYKNAVEEHLDFWTTGTSSGERITYTPKGLAWLDSWGSLRYATTTAYVAAVYSEWEGCPSNKVNTYWDFAVSQADYALGSTGFSYQIGFGDSYPVNPHHRTAQGSYCDNMNEPAKARHVLYGALVGGPGANDDYTDTVSNYNTNEVACDYNAGFTGLLAKLYSRYHGETLKDFGAVETIYTPEYYVEASVNASGDDFIEMRTFVYNVTAWPARTAKDLEYRYFVDLSEVFAAGGDANSITVTTNYMQNGSYNGIFAWDEDNHIYYISVLFSDSLAPRGQSDYKSELQIRMKSDVGAWDNSNDPSYPSLNGSFETVALYDNGTLIFGFEPGEGGASAGSQVTSGGSDTSSNPTTPPASTGNSNTSAGGSASSGDLTLNVTYDSIGSTANSISGTIEITNNGSTDISVSSLELNYYLTNTTNKDIVFDCYHAAVNGANGSYTQLTNIKANITDSCVTIGTDENVSVSKGSKITISFSLHYSDWSTFDSSDDYSAQSVENIVIISNKKVVYGTEP